MTRRTKDNPTARVTNPWSWIAPGVLLTLAALLFGQCNWLTLVMWVTLLVISMLLILIAIVLSGRICGRPQTDMDGHKVDTDEHIDPGQQLFGDCIRYLKKYRVELMQLGISAPLLTVASLQIFEIAGEEIKEVPLPWNLDPVAFPIMILLVTACTSVYMLCTLFLVAMLGDKWFTLRAVGSAFGLAFALMLLVALMIQVSLVAELLWLVA